MGGKFDSKLLWDDPRPWCDWITWTKATKVWFFFSRVSGHVIIGKPCGDYNHAVIGHPKIWVNFITTSPFSQTLESWFLYGKSSPFMAARFRLVKYYNLPIYIYAWFSQLRTSRCNLPAMLGNLTQHHAVVPPSFFSWWSNQSLDISTRNPSCWSYVHQLGDSKLGHHPLTTINHSLTIINHH